MQGPNSLSRNSAWWKARHDGKYATEAWGLVSCYCGLIQITSLLGNSLKSVSWKICCVGSRGLRDGGGERETRSVGPAIEGDRGEMAEPLAPMPV